MRIKKSQITLFLIIGIVVTVLTVGIIYFVGSVKTRATEDEIMDSARSLIELEPLVNYFEKCVDKVAKKGMFLLGKQGGLIYMSQGGTVIDFLPSMEGFQYAVDEEGNNVTYFIGKPVAGGFLSLCKYILPEYPVNLKKFQGGRPYPYADWAGSLPDFSSEKNYVEEGCFGKSYPLSTVVMMNSLESYIEKNVASDCGFSAFKNYQVNFTEPIAKVESSVSKTEVFLTYPMTLTNLNTGAKSQLKEFRTSIKLSLDGLASFINMVIRQDVGDPTYAIWRSFEGYDFAISINKDVYNHDDIIIIAAEDLLLDGIPFKFKFARKNRYPVLDYIYNTSFDEVSLIVDNVIYWDDVIHQNLTYVDPDEDEVTLKVLLGEGFPVELSETQPYVIRPGDVLFGDIPVNITVSDGQYADYQTFMIG